MRHLLHAGLCVPCGHLSSLARAYCSSLSHCGHGVFPCPLPRQYRDIMRATVRFSRSILFIMCAKIVKLLKRAAQNGVYARYMNVDVLRTCLRGTRKKGFAIKEIDVHIQT